VLRSCRTFAEARIRTISSTRECRIWYNALSAMRLPSISCTIIDSRAGGFRFLITSPYYVLPLLTVHRSVMWRWWKSGCLCLDAQLSSGGCPVERSRLARVDCGNLRIPRPFFVDCSSGDTSCRAGKTVSTTPQRHECFEDKALLSRLDKFKRS
jgi:hypothetical protein